MYLIKEFQYYMCYSTDMFTAQNVLKNVWMHTTSCWVNTVLSLLLLLLLSSSLSSLPPPPLSLSSLSSPSSLMLLLSLLLLLLFSFCFLLFSSSASSSCSPTFSFWHYSLLWILASSKLSSILLGPVTYVCSSSHPWLFFSNLINFQLDCIQS